MDHLRPSHSVDVQLSLIVAGQSYKLGQIGPEDCILRDPVDVPPCAAVVVMTIDGSETRWPVVLVEGSSAASPLVRYVDIG